MDEERWKGMNVTIVVINKTQIVLIRVIRETYKVNSTLTVGPSSGRRVWKIREIPRRRGAKTGERVRIEDLGKKTRRH